MRAGYPKQGSGGFSAMPLSDYVDSKALAANTPEDITVPAGAAFAILGGTVDFYARRTSTAAVPTDIADGTGSQLNPYIIAVEPGEVISVISAATCLVTIAYYGKG